MIVFLTFCLYRISATVKFAVKELPALLKKNQIGCRSCVSGMLREIKSGSHLRKSWGFSPSDVCE